MSRLIIKSIFHFQSYVVVLLFLCDTVATSQSKTEGVDFSMKRGFYADSIQLVLSCETPDAAIRFTLDGSKPTPSNGLDYIEPISIKTNAMVRAYAHTSGLEDAKIKTHSYIFSEQVIRQKNNMKEDYGYEYSSKETGKVFWTEEMDPEIVNADTYKDEIVQGLKDIPTLCVVMAKEDLWGENGIHWGDNLEEDGDDFERECSIEMIYPDGYKGDILKNWQENCGIKIQGGGGRWDKGTYDHKQSFTLAFRKRYGAGKLKNELFADAPHGKRSTAGKYDKIILRSGHNKSWGANWDREKSVYTRDQLGRDLQILMSDFGSHGTFVHLYLNGKYWGLYNPCERPDNNFLANYFGGESEDYFYAKGKDSGASDDRAGEPGQSKSRFYEANSKNYNKMSFDEMQNWVMVDQSIASFLVHGYANPGDGPQYYYGNNNNPAGPVVWIPWDIEDSFDGGSRRTGPPSVDNMIDDKKNGDNGFEAFWTNPDFRMRFSDLVYGHFYNEGVMTDGKVMEAWDRLTNYIYKPIICESARWGDERSTNPMDRDHEWNNARLAVRNDFKGRGNDFISKLQKEGYFSTIPAPVFSSTNNTITISRGGEVGEIYYTLNGSDPRVWNLSEAISDSAKKISGTLLSFDINETTTIRARAKIGNSWSPLHKAIVLTDGTLIHEIAGLNEILSSGDSTATSSIAVKMDKLQLYPNPVTDILHLTKNEKYTVYSAMGDVIMQGEGSHISMIDLPDGLYLILIDNSVYKILKK